MSMHITVDWHRPIRLRPSKDFIYACETDLIPHAPGVYIFARMWGVDPIPIYVGKATDLRVRVMQQMSNNVRLMKGVENASTGDRNVLIGVLRRRLGVQVAKAIRTLEDALIAKFLERGYELLNDKGTRRPSHHLEFRGNLKCRNLSGRLIGVRMM